MSTSGLSRAAFWHRLDPVIGRFYASIFFRNADEISGPFQCIRKRSFTVLPITSNLWSGPICPDTTGPKWAWIRTLQVASKSDQRPWALSYELSILQVLIDRLPMIGYVITAGLFAALSTFKVVSGIDGLASWTGVVFLNFLEPLFIPKRLDPSEVDPEFDPMRHCRLKLFHVIAGILFTFTAKVDTSFSCTSKHLAFLTIGQPLVRTASIALALF